MEGSDYLKALLQRLNLVQNHFSPSIAPSLPLHTNLSENYREPSVKISQPPQGHISSEGKRTLREELLAHQKAIDELTLMVDNSKTTRKISRSSNLNVSISHLEEESQKKKQDKVIQIKNKDREVLIVVREKLKEIVQFLTKKIEVPRIVEMSDVRQNMTVSNSEIQKPEKKEEGNLLRLPRSNYQQNNERVEESQNILKNNPKGRDHLNLKQSFDKLNEINSSHSLFQGQQRQIIQSKRHFVPQLRQAQSIYSASMHPINIQNHQGKPNNIFQNPAPQMTQMRILQRPFSQSIVRNPNYSPQIKILRPQQFQQRPNIYPQNSPIRIMQQPILQRIPPQIPPNYYPASRPNFIQRPPTLRTMNPQPLSTDRNRLYNNQFSQNTINKPNIPIRYPQPRLILPNQAENLPHRSRQRQYFSMNRPEVRYHPHLQPNLRFLERSESQTRLKRKSSKHEANFDKQSNKSINQPEQQITRSFIKNIYQQKPPLFDLQAPKPYTNFSQNRQNPFESNRLYDSSKLQKSSVLKTDKILRPIAEKSQQNIISRKISDSKSSERLMSEVSEKTIYFSNYNKQGAGSTKLKRKGIQLSMKRAYMTQYRKQQ